MGGVEVVLLDPLSFGGALGAEGFRAMLAEQGVPAHVGASAGYSTGDGHVWRCAPLGIQDVGHRARGGAADAAGGLTLTPVPLSQAGEGHDNYA